MLSDGSRVLRAYGTFPHPNNFGGYLTVGILTTLALPFTGARRARGIIAAVLAVGLVITASRSALLGLILGGAITMMIVHVKRTTLATKLVMPIAFSVIALALGVTLFAPSLAASLRGGGALEDRSLSERADQYREFPATVEGTDWLIGNGPRNYVYAVADEHPERSVWDYQPIHNVPLLLASELGLIALILVIAWCASIDRINFARFPNREAAYACGMGMALLFVTFFDHYLWSSWGGLALGAYVMALSLRLGENER
jgi:O-antigen ligase